MELIAASGEVGIQVIVELCQVVLDGFGVIAERAPSIVVSVFKGNGDIRNCGGYIAVKLIVRCVKMVLEERV